MSGLPSALRRVYPPETEWATFHSSHRIVWPSANALNDSQISNAKDPLLEVQIPKPRGDVGCLSKGGYSLQKVLGWDEDFYREVQVCLSCSRLPATDTETRDIFIVRCPFTSPTGTQSPVRETFHVFMML